MSKARFPPLSRSRLKGARKRKVRIVTSVGEIGVEASYGLDAGSGRYVCPIRVLWGLEPNTLLSPVLEERLCYTAVSTFSYERAAKVAAKWGCQVDDSLIHRHVQQRGARAEALSARRVEQAVEPGTRPEVVAAAKAHCPRQRFSLVIMMDGWMVRERGEHWGLKPASTKAERVAWHEVKTGVVFRIDQRCETQSGRPMLLEKFMVAHRGAPFEFGQALYAEALRRGLAQAETTYVVADGGVWIWGLVRERFDGCVGLLDFYHASQHLWSVAHELFGEDEDKARAWVEPLLHQLRHGGEAGVLTRLENLCDLCEQLDAERAGKIATEVNYFTSHRDHLGYARAEKTGCPCGSGAMESGCSQLQGRFKRTGQFWRLPGETRLMGLEVSDRNGDWEQIWHMTPCQT